MCIINSVCSFFCGSSSKKEEHEKLLIATDIKENICRVFDQALLDSMASIFNQDNERAFSSRSKTDFDRLQIIYSGERARSGSEFNHINTLYGHIQQGIGQTNLHNIQSFISNELLRKLPDYIPHLALNNKINYRDHSMIFNFIIKSVRLIERDEELIRIYWDVDIRLDKSNNTITLSLKDKDSEQILKELVTRLPAAHIRSLSVRDTRRGGLHARIDDLILIDRYSVPTFAGSVWSQNYLKMIKEAIFSLDSETPKA